MFIIRTVAPIALLVSSAIAVADEAIFVDISKSAGLDFVHFNGMSGELYFPEMVGAGGALFDYDNDGDLDIYLVQGNMLGKDKTVEDAVFKPTLPLTDRLYRNDINSKGEVHFTDVTKASGIQAQGYGMGVTAGDYNNDGWIDLYVTNFGANQLLKNQGDGTFVDTTKDAGVNDSRWSVAAAFTDIDNDGWPDLYVGNYVDFDFDNIRPCFSASVVPEYCGPMAYDPTPDSLFRNLGNGKFEDISKSSGIDKDEGSGLGIVTTDFNGDHFVDLYVANDGRANNLWLNQGDGTFLDDGMLSGAAVNMDGMPEASMGVDAADFDDDGDEDLFMTHLTRESNTLYVNSGDGLFDDLSVATGIAKSSLQFTGFGMGWIDYDNDGWLDLYISNGGVTMIEQQVAKKDPLPLKQTNQLLRNTGKMNFTEVTDQAGSVFDLLEVGRGAAFGDIDNDGDTDILLINNSGPARLLRNEIGQQNSWLGLRLVDAMGQTNIVGAKAAIKKKDSLRSWRRSRREGSYASSGDPRVVFGLNDDSDKQSVVVVWPNGEKEAWDDLATNQYHLIKRGSGEAVQND